MSFVSRAPALFGVSHIGLRRRRTRPTMPAIAPGDIALLGDAQRRRDRTSTHGRAEDVVLRLAAHREPRHPARLVQRAEAIAEAVRILWTYDWWLTSQTILSLGASSTRCRPSVGSTTPRFGARWPPLREQVATSSSRISRASTSTSARERPRRSRGESIPRYHRLFFAASASHPCGWALLRGYPGRRGLPFSGARGAAAKGAPSRGGSAASGRLGATSRRCSTRS